MRAPDNKEWLDCALRDALASEAGGADFAKWKRENPEAVERLKLSGADVNCSHNIMWRKIMKGSVIKVVAAAVLLACAIGITVLAYQSIGSEEQVTVQGAPDEQLGNTESPGLQETLPARDLQLAEDIKKVEQMFAAGDIDGLVGMLGIGEYEAKVVAANYLAKIGDERALEALRKLVDTWQGAPNANPFAAAVEEIEKRAVAEAAETKGKTVLTKEPKNEFEPRGVLSGLITDAKTGQPISDAEIQVAGARPSDVRTDANGFYWFEKVREDGEHKIGVRCFGYLGFTDHRNLPTVFLAMGKKAVKHFALERGCMVDIDVVDANGLPIEGVRITAADLTSEYYDTAGRDTKTDPNGQAQSGTFKPSDTGYIITAIHDEYAPACKVVRLTDPEVIEFAQMVLQKGVDVKGYAEYSDGVPAADLKIGARPDWWRSAYGVKSYQIEKDGSFVLKHITAGNYGIEVAIPMGENMWRVPTVARRHLPLEADEGLLVVKLPQRSPQSLVSISGTITFTGTEAPGEIYIDASSSNGASGSTHVEDVRNGFIIDRLEPGVYKLDFSGAGVENKRIENIEAPSQGLQVVLNEKSASSLVLTGTVIDPNGKAITEFRARARKLETLGGFYYDQEDRWQNFRYTEGRFSIKASGRGIYQVQIAAENLPWTWSEEINTDYNHSVVVELGSGGTIKGRVVDETGNPVSGAKVIPLSKASGNMPRVKDVFVSEEGAVETKEGDFVLKNLSPGVESLKVTHPGYSFSILGDIQVSAGQTADAGEIVLKKGGSAQGYVYDLDGRPRPNVTLRFQDKFGYGGEKDEEAGTFAVAVTDSNGFYSVSGLPEQLCYVDYGQHRRFMGVTRRTFIPQNNKTTELNLGGSHTIRGQVLFDGQPLQNAALRLGDIYRASAGTFVCSTTTDSYGNFKFNGAVTGRYNIYFDSSGGQSPETALVQVEVVDSDVDLGVISRKHVKLLVSLAAEDDSRDLKDMEVSLHEGDLMWARREGKVSPPEGRGEPWIISDVMPGRYTVAVITGDGIRLIEPVEVTGAEAEQRFKVNIPKATAAIHGRYITKSDFSPSVIAWRSDKKIVAYLSSSAYKRKDGTYRIEGLPAGEYGVGNLFFSGAAPLAAFTISEGEDKTVDIDTSDFSNSSNVFVRVRVIADDGVLLSGADAWLEDGVTKVYPVMPYSEGPTFAAKPGRYMLHAEHPGYKHASREVILTDINILTLQERPPVIIKLTKL